VAYKDITVEKKRAVAWITLNKPQVRNALGKQTLSELLAALDDISEIPEIAVLVIKGAGGTFCSGMDLTEISGPTGPGAQEFTKLADRVFLGIEKCKKITIAMVEGYCMAGGFEIALGCDFIVVAENCKIGDGHINLPGFVPNGGSSVRLPRLIGRQKAKQILLTGDLISGREAAQIGIAAFAVPSEQLAIKVTELAEKIAAKSPVGLQYMKMLVDSSGDASLEAGLALERTAVKFLSTTKDAREAMAALKEKRKPHFTGE